MARIEEVFYECDWCKEKAPAVIQPMDDEELPEGWVAIDQDILCTDCKNARAKAIFKARNDRLNRR